MKTIQEQIAVMQHFANGGKVEYLSNEIDNIWYQCTHPSWNWIECQFRIAQPKKQKMWQWIMKTEEYYGTTNRFFPNKDAVLVDYPQCLVIKPALWTEIEL